MVRVSTDHTQVQSHLGLVGFRTPQTLFPSYFDEEKKFRHSAPAPAGTCVSQEWPRQRVSPSPSSSVRGFGALLPSSGAS